MVSAGERGRNRTFNLLIERPPVSSPRLQLATHETEPCADKTADKNTRTRGSQITTQGLMTVAPVSAKSFTLRVTIARPCSSAVAVIRPSAVVIVTPFLFA